VGDPNLYACDLKAWQSPMYLVAVTVSLAMILCLNCLWTTRETRCSFDHRDLGCSGS